MNNVPFENNMLVCPRCGNNDREAMTITDVPDNDVRVTNCDFCFEIIRKVSLTAIKREQGYGGIKR